MTTRNKAQRDTWRQYVSSTMGDDTQAQAAQVSGLYASTICRWLADGDRAVTPHAVAAFARAYERPVLEAFVAAGLLSESDVHIKTRTLSTYSTRALQREIKRRVNAAA